MADSSSTERREVALDHGALSFLEAGSGSPLVLLHGVGSAAQSWRAQLAGLSGRHRVIAWDAPGYGASAALAPEAPRADDYAAALVALLDALDIAGCHLVGHSLGSLIAGRFARLHPARLHSLTLASCALGHAPLAATERERLLTSRLGDLHELGARAMAEKRGPRLLGPDASPAHVRAVVDTMAGVDPHGYGQAARMLSGGDLVADIAALPAELPVQFVWGSADVITPPAANERAAQARPGAERHVLERAGHACYVEQADAFNDVLSRFTRAHDPTTGERT